MAPAAAAPLTDLAYLAHEENTAIPARDATRLARLSHAARRRGAVPHRPYAHAAHALRRPAEWSRRRAPRPSERPQAASGSASGSGSGSSGNRSTVEAIAAIEEARQLCRAASILVRCQPR